MLSNLEEEANSGTKFKELFCVAANELAECIHEPLISLGVLFESIMLTGTIDKPRKWFPRPLTANSLSHAEHGRMHPAFGRGQVLFLVRQANKRDAAQFQAAGFNFAYLTHIIPSLAQSMEVTIGELSGKLHRIYRSLPYQSMIGSGVHIACYALRPKFPLRGWDILINEDRRNLLPSVRLTTTSLQSWQMGILTKLDNMTAKECNLYLQHRISDAQGAEKAFLSSVDRAIGSLAAQIEHPLFDNARFRSHPYEVPCESLPGSQRRAKATVMMFRVIADAHYSSPLNGRFEFGSSRLFRAQQHVYPRSPDHGAFARQVHLEFAGLAEGRTEAKATSPIVSGYSTPRKPSKSSEGSSPAEPAVGTNGEHDSPFATSQWSLGKVGSEKKKPGQGYNARSFFGGIHVQNEISVDVSEVEERPNSKHSSELSDLGMHSEVTVAPTEIDTFADELMLLLIEERRQQSVRGRTV